MGVQAIKFKKEGDVLVDVRGVADDDEVLVVTSGGTIARVAANTIAAQSRTAKGVSVQKSTAKDPCVGISLVPGDLAGVVAEELSAANRAIVSSFTSNENVWLCSGTYALMRISPGASSAALITANTASILRLSLNKGTRSLRITRSTGGPSG